MTSRGGSVKATLELDIKNFEAGIKRAQQSVEQMGRKSANSLNQLDKSMSGGTRGVKSLTSSLREAESAFGGFNKTSYTAGANLKGLQKTVNEIQSTFGGRGIDKVFNYDARKYDAALKKMENSTTASTSRIRRMFDSISNSANFTALTNKFDAAVKRMQNTAKAGGTSIRNSLSDSLNATDYMAAIFGGMAIQDVWEKGMGRAVTQTMLKNAGHEDFYGGYQKFTIASSTSDADINRMFQAIMTAPGMRGDLVYKALNAADSASFSPDPVQRYRDMFAWSSYIQGGWDQAGRMLKDEGLTKEQQDMLQAANTPEERIAALESIAKTKGTVDEFGNSISTTTTGPMANYNKALVMIDTITRGMIDGFNKLLDKLSPVIDWFNSLSNETKSLIGQIVFFTGVILTVGAGLRILMGILSPLTGAFKALVGLVSGSGGVNASLDGFSKKTKSSSNSLDGSNWLSSGSSSKSKGKTSTSTRLNSAAFSVAGAITLTALAGVAILGSINAVGGDSDSDLADAYEKAGLKEVAKEIRESKVPHKSTAETLNITGSGVKVGGYGGADQWRPPTKEEIDYAKKYGLEVPSKKSVFSLPQDFKGPAQDTSAGGLLNNILHLPSGIATAFGGGGFVDWINNGLGKSFTDLIQGPIGANNGQGPTGGLFSPVAASDGKPHPSFTDDLKSIFGVKDWKFPSSEEILNTIKNGLGIKEFKIPSSNDILNWIKNKLGIKEFKIPSINDIGNWIKSKVGFLNWQIPSLSSLLSIISPRIGWLQFPSISQILAMINIAIQKMLGTYSPGVGLGVMRGPAGPGTSFISMASGNGGFTYKGYEGVGQSLGTTLSTTSGNCVDGSIAQIYEAEKWGIPARMVATTWRRNPHVLTQMNFGRGWVDRDIANHAITGSWSRPPSGPNGSSGEVVIEKGAIQITGNNFNSQIDVEQAVEAGIRKAFKQYGKRLKRG